MRDIQAFLVADAVADFSREDHDMALALGGRHAARSSPPPTRVLQGASDRHGAELWRPIRADVADMLGEDPADIPVDENLVDYGLDSVRIMALIERWRRDHGVEATFVDLAEQPAIEAWAPLLGVSRRLPSWTGDPGLTGLPLTAAQSGMWFAQALDPASPAQNTAECLEIHGPSTRRVFAEALRQVVAEADALRVRIIEDPGRAAPVRLTGRRPHAAAEGPGSARRGPGRRRRAWMRRDLATPFDLAAGPLFAHALFRVGDERWLWYQRVHHIVMDGFGYSLLARRTAEIYTALAAGEDAGAQPLRRLADLVAEDAAYRGSRRVRRRTARTGRGLRRPPRGARPRRAAPRCRRAPSTAARPHRPEADRGCGAGGRDAGDLARSAHRRAGAVRLAGRPAPPTSCSACR